jgi:hypothetical protein
MPKLNLEVNIFYYELAFKKNVFQCYFVSLYSVHSFWEHQLSSFDGSMLKYFLLVMGARV